MFCGIYDIKRAVVRNQYTLGHFLAHFTQTCSIMRADEKFLAIFPCKLGLLPENLKHLPEIHFKCGSVEVYTEN